MKRRKSPGIDRKVVRTLTALGGEGTPGDVVALVASSRAEVEASVERLMARKQVEVRVSDSGDVVYRLARRDDGGGRSGAVPAARGFPWLRTQGAPGPRGAGNRAPTRTGRRPDASPPTVRFDRKTLHLIRAREGVISLAELVEHTGTSVAEARREMRRLVGRYGGEAHPSLDGHVVFAFPMVMTTVNGWSELREPRPAWMRFHDPMGSRRFTENGSWLGRVAYSLGLLRLGRGLVQRLETLRTIRSGRRHVLRRLALGHVFETALAGRGVVSVGSTRTYLESRSRSRVRRRKAEAVLRELAVEFDAPITREGDELFFGFRNVKRQFLASEVVRRRLRLRHRVTGRTVFDSGDSSEDAARRELDAFDRELEAGR